MMKKLLVLLLSAMMVMSLVACGGDDTTVEDQQVENDVAGEDQQVENDADVVDEEEQQETGVFLLEETAGDGMPVMYAAFGNDTDLLALDAYGYSNAADYAGTSWLMAGGRDANVEQTADAHLANMQGLNGVGGFQFEADNYVVLLLGENYYEGSYEVQESGAISINLDMGDTGYPDTYVCTILDGGDGTLVLVAFSDETFENCIYMVNMNE